MKSVCSLQASILDIKAHGCGVNAGLEGYKIVETKNGSVKHQISEFYRKKTASKDKGDIQSYTSSSSMHRQLELEFDGTINNN